MRTKSRLGLLGAILCVGVGTFGIAPGSGSCAADESDVYWNCIPELSEKPAAGDWTGDAEFDYTMSVPDTPAAFALQWRGRIDLELAKEPDERARRSTCPRAIAGSNPDLSAPPQPGCNVDGTPVQPLARDDEKPPEVRGATDVTMAMHLGMREAGSEVTEDVASQRAANLNNAADMDRDGKRLAAIALVGTPSQFQFGGSFSARDDEGAVAGDVETNGGGTAAVRGTVTGDLRGTAGANVADGRITNDIDVVDRDGQRHAGTTSTAVAGIDQNRRTLFRLVIEKRECGQLEGRVESQELVSQVQDAGMVFTPGRSVWHATHADRDEALERAAQRYADEPVRGMNPDDPEGTWASWQREWGLYSALRGRNPSDYVLCALKPAHEKIIRASTLALRALLDGRLHDDLTVRLWMARLMSVIEGFGRESYVGCPVVRGGDGALVRREAPAAAAVTRRSVFARRALRPEALSPSSAP